MSLARATREMTLAVDELRTTQSNGQRPIFLSYASADRALVTELAGFIEAQQYVVWWDKEISAGDKFGTRIRDALERACAVIVLWTRRSVNSSWVRWEANHGLRLGKLIPVAEPGLDFGDIWPP
ncbi:MAG: toll/interleukin-1 receptor domain-containing protein, partial [Hyphomicrobiaceae bacterium]